MLGRLRAAHGDNYYDWILDQAGIETVLANRVAMTPPSRPGFAGFLSRLLFPFDNKQLENDRDRQDLFSMEDAPRQSYFQQAGRPGPRLPWTSMWRRWCFPPCSGRKLVERWL